MNPQDLTRFQKLEEKLRNIPLSGPDLDEVFYVFAVRVNDDSVGKRKLKAGKIYYFFDGFNILDDRVFVTKDRFQKTPYDYYDSSGNGTSPHVSISAIVGENGAGKSSLIEFEMRLINNFSVSVFGEQVNNNANSHLHYIEGMNGELFYIYNKTIYQLVVDGRSVKIHCFVRQDEEKDEGHVVFLQSGSIDIAKIRDGLQVEGLSAEMISGSLDMASLKSLLSHFFYTVVLNQSVYAYNTNDYRQECNSEEYEIAVRGVQKKNEKGEIIPYSVEDKCWLNGLFHKNDGYQIPIVLTPCRVEGNYDINVENRLAYERLISIMVRTDIGSPERIINGHLRVVSFDLKRKRKQYDLAYINDNVGFRQFTEDDFAIMTEILLSTWSAKVGIDLLKDSRSFKFRDQAINYLVYKTLKIANTYNEYGDFREQFQTEAHPFNAEAFQHLVERMIENDSHVTKKIYRTIAYLIWDIYEVHSANDSFSIRIDDITKRWCDSVFERKLDYSDRIVNSLVMEAAIPPPFFESSIGLVDINKSVLIPFEHLSSGEKQQAYTTSTLVYHLKNLDSVFGDRSTKERVTYECVQLILEEVELYFHPELQRVFIKNLLDGIKQANLYEIKWISICVVTHSPFVLSDIPTRNVLALRINEGDVERIPSFGANLHDMMKYSFFLNNGSIGEFAMWNISRLARCMRVTRWINKQESAPTFFPSLEDVQKEYDFLEDFKTLINKNRFSEEGFKMVYSSEVILSQIVLVEEPLLRRVLLEEYRRTFPEKNDEYKTHMKAMLQAQMDALK